MTASWPFGEEESLKSWFIVNNRKRYCYLNHERLDVAEDDSSDNLEYSVQVSKIIDSVAVSDVEFDILPENSPKLHFMSDDIDTIQKWKNAIFNSNNFEYLHQNVPKMNYYTLSKAIGEGFSGKVHLVRRKSDQKLYALKLINKNKLSNQSSIKRLITERNVLIQNNYPFITKLYSAFQTDSYLVLALEYVGGGDLQHHLDKGICFSQQQIKIYLAQLVLTLEHLHDMGIVFRDLKPSNILIAKDGNLKLADFGLSKNIIDTGRTKTFCGTHDYLSPEMINGDFYDYSVDWWALGVIAYRLICNILPFNSPNLNKLFEKICSCRYRIPTRIDQDSRDFISGLLKKNPHERFTIDQIKGHKFFSEIDWKKVYEKEYKLDFIPYRADDESAYNFDSSISEKYHSENYESSEYETSDSCSLSSSNSYFDLHDECEKSFIKGFSFSSTADDFDNDDL